MLDAVTYLFAQDLRAASADRPFVVFVDAYEALVPAPIRGGRSSTADVWLRDLISQLGRGLVVVASREPLGWQIYDTEWAQLIRDCPVGGLPAQARLELLTDSGLVDAAEQRAIARASEGLPFYLHLAIDTGASSGRATTVVSPTALEAQQELGALHELGKTHTAIAIARTRLGNHSGAAESFETARTYLERARYRSGLARAEFFRAFLHATQGHPGRAAACLTWAVGEFVAAEVYPTLIVLAAQALDHLGQPDPDVTRAADAARARIEPLDSITDLEQRAAALIAAMLGGMTVEWQDIYDRAAAHLEAAAGYYNNNNVRVDTPTGPLNVRIPIPDADVMDLRLWREEEILPALAGFVKNAPHLLHSSNEPRYQVHGFIDGVVLNTIAPRGVAVPPHVPADVVVLLTELTTIPRGKLPATPAGWPQDDDTIGFARRLSGLTHQVYATYRDQYSPQFQAFGFPADPLAAVEAAWPTLTRRPLVCVHSDIHRKNMIIKDEVSYFLDWELALWGDPVYDLAVHFHKMGYTPAERDHVLELWQAALRLEHTVGWERDLDVYLAHEQIKSAIVDTVRYSQAFLDPSYAPEPGHALVDKLTGKLNNAYRHWGMTDRVDVAVVEATLLAWAESRRRR